LAGAPNPEAPPRGDALGRVGVALVLARGPGDALQIECACGRPLGPADGNWRTGCVRQLIDELPRGIVVHASLELVRYLCPACGRQHGIEVAERGAPPLEDIRLT
ncbi:MAG: acetone carboxylase subunit gamma, partial [Solirubrobacteraceae bacterium]